MALLRWVHSWLNKVMYSETRGRGCLLLVLPHTHTHGYIYICINIHLYIIHYPLVQIMCLLYEPYQLIGAACCICVA